MSVLDEKIVRSITVRTTVPVVFRGYVDNWPLCKWNLEKWSQIFGQREYPFRCVNKYTQSEEPCWERRCMVRNISFTKFVEAVQSSDEAMYFDYKYLHEWFSKNEEISQGLSWEQFGFPGKGPKDTTLWVGSDGAHTPAHQDTYGVNIVVQVHGKKLWILFPPESGGLKPTRVPYEESSVYSELNFYCPKNVQVFQGLTGARVVELSAGDALIVPHKWWHYVQNENPVNISLNMWLPHEEDDSARISEAIIKIFVAQICKDLAFQHAKRVLNPTEDDLAETPTEDLLFQLKAAATQCLERDGENKAHRMKRQRTGDDNPSTETEHIEYNIEALLNNPDNKMEIPSVITGEELLGVIQVNRNRCKDPTRSFEEEDAIVRLIKPVINSVCQDNAVERFKQNILSKLRSLHNASFSRQ